MTKYHWGGMLLLLVIGYALGLYFPAPGMSLKSKLGM